MKKVLLSLIVLLTIILTSCSIPTYKDNLLYCNKNNITLKNEIIKIMTEEGFTLKNTIQNENNILFFDDNSTRSNSISMEYSINWSISLKEQEIICVPTFNIKEQYNVWIGKINESKRVFGPNTAKEYVGYWNVRYKLEELCDNIMICREYNENNLYQKKNK